MQRDGLAIKGLVVVGCQIVMILYEARRSVTETLCMSSAASPTSALAVDADAQAASEPAGMRPSRQLRFEEPSWCVPQPLTGPRRSLDTPCS